MPSCNLCTDELCTDHPYTDIHTKLLQLEESLGSVEIEYDNLSLTFRANSSGVLGRATKGDKAIAIAPVRSTMGLKGDYIALEIVFDCIAAFEECLLLSEPLLPVQLW